MKHTREHASKSANYYPHCRWTRFFASRQLPGGKKALQVVHGSLAVTIELLVIQMLIHSDQLVPGSVAAGLPILLTLRLLCGEIKLVSLVWLKIRIYQNLKLRTLICASTRFSFWFRLF